MAKPKLKKRIKKMQSTTVSPKKAKAEKGVVTLSLREYEELLERTVPNIYLSGKAAEDLDKLVKKGLRDHKAGKTRIIASFKDLF